MVGRGLVGRGVVVAVVVAIASLGVGSVPAGAAPSATVAPSSGLRPGDVVTASGSGFTPGDVVTLAQCTEGACTSPEGGPRPGFAVATVAEDGTLSGTVAVTASVGGFRCRPTGCWMAVSRSTGGGPVEVVAEVPLTFVAPSPAVAVSPGAGLLDGHPVQATLSGMDHGARYTVTQCGGATVASCRTAAEDEPGDLPPTGQTAEVVADRYTIARARLQMFRTLKVGATQYDCASVTCRVGVVDQRGVLVASTPLAFAASSSYVWPDASLTVTPSTGLRDTQVLTIDVAGFDPWESLGAGFPLAAIDVCVHGVGCQMGIALDIPMSRFRVVPIEPDGTGTTTFTFKRTFLLDDGEYVDCAVQGCSIRVHQDPNPFANEVELTFAPEWAPWPDVDSFLAEGVEAVRGGPLSPSARSEMASALTAHTLRGVTALVQAAGGSAPSDATVGEVTRLYRAFFGRAVETGGLGYWVGRLEAGATVASIGRSFGGTPEFRAQYDGLTNAQVVAKAYANTLGRAPDEAGGAYWTGRLDDGMARSTLIVHFARSAEFRAREARRVTITQITWGLLGRAPGPVELTLTPSSVAAGLLSSGQLPRP